MYRFLHFLKFLIYNNIQLEFIGFIPFFNNKISNEKEMIGFKSVIT